MYKVWYNYIVFELDPGAYLKKGHPIQERAS